MAMTEKWTPLEWIRPKIHWQNTNNQVVKENLCSVFHSSLMSSKSRVTWLSPVEIQKYKKVSYLQSPQDFIWVRLMELFEACSNAKGYPKTRTWLKVNIHKKTERSSVNYFRVWTAYQKQTNNVFSTSFR